MDELKVGEYGRTNKGKIIKFAWYEKEKGILNDKAVILVDKMRTTTDCFYYFEKGECIVKHSKNIIDLIEVGDIVNGYKVINVINEEPCPSGKCIDIDSSKDSSECTLWEEDIRTILTKEQYEANCYKVKEE